MTPARPASPCVDVCTLDASRVCVGCRRTLDEIARWGGMSATEQWQVIDRLERARSQDDGIARRDDGRTIVCSTKS